MTPEAAARYDQWVMRCSRRQILWAIGLFVAFTLLGALLFSYHYLDDLANQQYGTLPRRLIEEGSGAYSALLLLPLVLWYVRKFSPSKYGWPRSLLAWLFGAICFSLLHTTLMATSRALLFSAFGLGHYNYGIMPIRYPMEASNDIIYFFLLSSIIHFLDRMESARRAELEAVELQASLAEAKLENLRLQLHPHFLFNTLNAISSVMYEDVRKADEMLAKLSDFLRVVLASTGVHEVPIDEELAVEQMYVGIMKARLERSLSLHVNVEEDARDATVPFMLLQPLLENSIRHGMSSERNAIDLAIDVERANGSTVIRVSDDGVGFVPTATRGIGLSNVASRLAHMYGAQASFTIEPRVEGGTIATLCFPFTKGHV